MEDNFIICTCLDMTKAELVAEIKQRGLKTIEQVGDEIEAGAVCGSCIDDIQDVLDEVNG